MSHRYCIATGCGQSGSKGFFALPKNEEVAKSWLQSLKASEYFLTKKNSFICYRHFDSFKLDGKRLKPKAGRYLNL